MPETHVCAGHTCTGNLGTGSLGSQIPEEMAFELFLEG